MNKTKWLKVHYRFIVLIYLRQFSALRASWTQQCRSVRTGVVGHTACYAAGSESPVTTEWLHCQKSETTRDSQQYSAVRGPNRLTWHWILLVISVSVCICIQQCESASLPTCLAVHTAAADQLDNHTIESYSPGRARNFGYSGPCSLMIHQVKSQ